MLVLSAFVMPVRASHTTLSHPVISEIQIDSIDGSGGTGDDWIELYNPTDCPISLEDWSIQRANSSGTIAKKNFEEGDFIPGHGYFLTVASTAQTSILTLADMTSSSLTLSDNNTVYLVNDQENVSGSSDSNIVDKVGFGISVVYEGAAASLPPDGGSIERKPGGASGSGQDTDDNSADFQTKTPAGPQNSSSDPSPDPGECFTPPPPSPPGSPPSPPDSSSDPDESTPSIVSIADARKLPKGAEVIIEGIATVKPGILGSQYFYIQDSSGGMQIYSSKKLFPDTHIGQRLKITGEISESNNEKRIKIFTAKDAASTGSGHIEAKVVGPKDIGENYEGVLVKVSGKIAESSGSTFFVEDSGVKVKIIIRKDTGIVKPRTSEGDQVSVVGIVSQYKSEYRILPREQSDLVFETEGQSEESEEAEEEEPQDETSTEENTSSPNVTSVKGAETSRNPGSKVLAWTVAGTGGLFVLLPLVLWIFRAQVPGVVEKLKNLLARFRKT
jgi:DNA/RNA endonuclease YhcR with UshA esterase domain